MTHGARLIASYLLNICDLLLTLFWISLFGLQIEGNPLGRVMLENPIIAVLIKVIGVGILIYILYAAREKKLAVIGSNVVFAVYLSLIVYHVLTMTVVMRQYFS